MAAVKKRICVVGSGGREHAIGWAFEQEGHEVFYSSGNGGTQNNYSIDGTKKQNFPDFISLMKEKGIDLVVVGPEQPLVDGLVDYARSVGFNNVFGPTSWESVIESDKFWTEQAMRELGIPQARSIRGYTELGMRQAIQEIFELSDRKGVVLKARGLTGGKGVLVCDTLEEALEALPGHIKAYGGPHGNLLVAERLFGQEFSVFGISDGQRVIPWPVAIQDHKRLYDKDQGPNTGGMGAYGPAPVADAALVRKVADEMMTPLMQYLWNRGQCYKGFVYAAVIKTNDGPKILEYNCRLGDPETQPLVMLLKNGLYQPIQAALEGRLDPSMMEVKEGSACCVVLARKEYPGKVEGNLQIGGLEQAAKVPGVIVFHAGTKIQGYGDPKMPTYPVTSGGRVLGVTAHAPTLREAQTRAYEAANLITIPGGFHLRLDIANKGLVPSSSLPSHAD